MFFGFFTNSIVVFNAFFVVVTIKFFAKFFPVWFLRLTDVCSNNAMLKNAKHKMRTVLNFILIFLNLKLIQKMNHEKCKRNADRRGCYVILRIRQNQPQCG